MNQILGDLNNVYALVYLDNSLIFPCTEEKLWKHKDMVFNRFTKLKYHVKHKKFELFSKKFGFFSHTVSDAGVFVV